MERILKIVSPVELIDGARDHRRRPDELHAQIVAETGSGSV